MEALWGCLCRSPLIFNLWYEKEIRRLDLISDRIYTSSYRYVISQETVYALGQGSSTRGSPAALGRVSCGPVRVFHKIQCVMNIEASVTRYYMTKGK